MLDILVIMNNYFHDVATAVLLSSAVVIWVLGKAAEKSGHEAQLALARALPALTKFARGAIIWIIIGGVPRVIFFTRYEWDPAVIKGIVPALVVKHVLMTLAVVAGAIMWRRMAKVAGALQEQESSSVSGKVVSGGA